MEPRAVYEKNSEEISTSLFHGVAAAPRPVSKDGSDSQDSSSFTWFQRLSPDQKTSSRFTLPDWLRRSKGSSSAKEKEKEAPGPSAGQPKESPPLRPRPAGLHHTSSMPDLNARTSSLLEVEKPLRKVEGGSSSGGLNASFLAPLAELGQMSSRLRIDVPWKQPTSPVASQQQYQQPPQLLRPGAQQQSEDSDLRSSWEYGQGKQPARSLTTVLRHLSNVVDRTGQVPQDYRDSDFKQYWMPDSQCKECYECGEKFTTLRRRHHCRVCGQIFCRRCCNQEVPGKFMGYTGTLRVCTYCCKVVLSYAQSSIGELKLLQEDYFTLVASEMPSATTPDIMTPRKKTADSTMTRQRTFSSGSADGGFDPFELVQQSSVPSNLQTSFQNVAKERQHLLKDSAQLHQLWKLIQHPNNGIMFQNHRFRLRTYNDCIVGNELVDWLLLKDKVTDRLQALAIGQALLDAKWLESATSHDRAFRDEYALYKAGETALSMTTDKITLTAEGELDEIEDRMEPSWFRDINLEDKGDLTDDDGLVSILPSQPEAVESVRTHRRATSMGDSIGTWTKGRRPATDLFTAPSLDKVAMETVQTELSGPWENNGSVPGIGEVFSNGALSNVALDQTDHSRGPIMAHGWLDMDMVSQENGERETLDTLRAASGRTLVSLAEQRLTAEGLDLSWKETVITLANRICSLVKPDVMINDNMDIRHYVHIKKVPGGSQADCFIVNGTVCTKNIAHKKMAGHLSNPKILLLQSAIEHQRVENKFSSIDPIVLQEHEHLKKCVSRIASLKPDILIVEKTVARLAQMFLLHSGISLVLNVKLSVMDRLSRCTEVGLIRSIDQVNQTTPLGRCLMFRLQKYELPKGFSKTLMFFEGCPGHLGCSVVLRGGDHDILKKVKRVLQFMIYANYHSHLEISFLMDEFAKPPASQPQGEEADEGSRTDDRLSPDACSPLSPTTLGISDSVSEGLASVNGGLAADGGPAEQVDIVSEKALAEEAGQQRDEADGSSSMAGFRATMSSMKQRLKARVAGVASHALHDPETEAAAAAGGTRHEEEEEVRSDHELFEEIPEAGGVRDCRGVPPESAPPESLSADSKNDKAEREGGALPEESEQGIPRILEYDDQPAETGSTPMPSQSSRSPVENQDRVDANPGSQPGVSVAQLQGPTPDFDHEATTKEIESRFVELKRRRLIGADSCSIGSQEDLHVLSPPMPSAAAKSRPAFCSALDKTLLCISPHVKLGLPYMETKPGRESPLRRFFLAKEFYTSPRLTQSPDPGPATDNAKSAPDGNNDDRGNAAADSVLEYKNVDRCSRPSEAVIVNPPHPFTFSQLTEDSRDEAMLSLLADFRARGGRIVPRSATVNRSFQGHQHGQNPPGKGQLMTAAAATVPLAYRQLADCLDIHNHQRMLLQFCSYSHLSSNAPNHCVNPWMVTMEFYNSRHDLTLGEFLERYCFSTKYTCPNELCDADMVDHIRRFAHGNASIHVLLRNLESPIPGYTDKILMWSWCRKCRQVTPVQPMSLDTWHMSFGKYLELRFYCKDYGRRLSALPCGHSLHRHHYQYFGQHNIVASFKYSPILLREIGLPPLPLTINQVYRRHADIAEEFKAVSTKGSHLLSEIVNKINTLTGILGSNALMQQHIEQKNAQFMAQFQADSNKFWNNAKDIQAKSTTLAELVAAASPRASAISDLQLELEDRLVTLKQIVCSIAISWNTRFSEFVQQEKERNKRKSGSGVSRQNTGNEREPSMATVAAAAIKELEQSTPNSATPPRSPQFFPPTEQDEASSVPPLPTAGSMPVIIPTGPSLVLPNTRNDLESTNSRTLEYSLSPADSDVAVTPPPLAYLDHLGLNKLPNYGISPGLYAGLAYKPSTDEPPKSDLTEEDPANDLVVIDTPADDVFLPESGVRSTSTMQLSPDNRESGNKSASSLPEGSEQADSSASAKGESHPPSPFRGKHANSSTMKSFFSTLMTSSDLARVETPYPPNEHHVLPSCTVMPVIIYDQEPSTIIAYALSSEKYKTQLYELQQPDSLQSSEATPQSSSNPSSRGSSPVLKRHHAFTDGSQGPTEGKERSKKGQLTRRASRTVISFLRGKIPENSSSSQPSGQRAKEEGQFTYTDTILCRAPGMEESSFNTSPVAEMKDESDFDFTHRSSADKRDAPSPHIDLQFTDAAHTQFFCLVYHADQFRQLRKILFPAGEETYIRSLSCSVTWLAQGGKSRSKFLKTIDDRFVLKQISRLEFQFFKDFAPHYIKYIQQAHAEQRPTCLAKILGIYKVGYQNPVTNTAQKHVLLVMENLFYQRRMAQVFDLKGSVRNRHVKTTGQEQQDLVLMDENLLRHMVDSPLFVRSHSKAALSMAVNYDSTFLASHFIMDYSLLVGLDANTDELVVGIIDYIRTFTWDKKLEMMVKSTGIVGGQGKLPTVVSPELYRTRFCEAMDKYFLLVPDRWTNLGTEF